MKPETKFILLRISIYLTGFLIISWVIGINIWEIKSKTAPLIRTENGDYFIYTDRNYDQAELTLNFKTEIPENLQVEISKDFSVFLTHQKKGIYSEEKLTKKLFKNNPTQYPNGSFLNFKKNIYFLDEGILKPLATSSILEIFNLSKESLINIDAEDFKKIPQGELLTKESIQKNFPKNIIIKKNDIFYITGSEGYYPIVIPNPKKLIGENNLIKISPNPIQGKCYKKSTRFQVICKFELNKSNSNIGNVYTIRAYNNGLLNINNPIIELIGNPTFLEIGEEIKKMFTK